MIPKIKYENAIIIAHALAIVRLLNNRFIHKNIQFHVETIKMVARVHIRNTYSTLFKYSISTFWHGLLI